MKYLPVVDARSFFLSLFFQKACFMGKTQRKDKRRWYQKLMSKYRLVVLNYETYEERFSFKLTRLNVFVFLGTVAIILILLTTVIIAFTPLREYIPGYMDPTLPKRVYANEQKADSLEMVVRQKDIYINTIRDIIEGNEINDTLVTESVKSVNYDTITLQRSTQDSIFRAQYEKQNQYNLYIYENQNPFEYTTNAKLSFFTPLKGTITNNFDLANKHYGIDIVSRSNESVKATLEGTVIFSDWTLETGYVIGIMHPGNYISVYKHNSSLLKKIGSYVNAGEPIAIVGETGELSTGPHLHFELWHNGTPVNPLEYIAF